MPAAEVGDVPGRLPPAGVPAVAEGMNEKHAVLVGSEGEATL